MARVTLMGTPEFGVPVLEALNRHHEVVLVVTQPDRPAGRGRRTLLASPVKEAAVALGLPVIQPASLRRDRAAVEALRRAEADVAVIAAFGQILRPDVLAIPPHGVLGVPASLLPRLRGAAPIAAAIMQGATETGISLMLTDAGMDTGAIVAQSALPILPQDTTASLSARLARLGADLLIALLPAWLRGELRPRPQDNALATAAPPLEKAAGAIDWSRPAISIDRQVRALIPWPIAYTEWAGQRLQILAAHPLPGTAEGVPGQWRSSASSGRATGAGLWLWTRCSWPASGPCPPASSCAGGVN
jgi:methionyl-tRNA formyltransferase